MDGYSLSRAIFDFSFENPDKIKPTHLAMFFFAIEHCNRLGWKEKFGFPSSMVMEAIGISSYKTYKITFDDLVTYGFFILITASKNQYSSNVIALVKNTKAHTKALDKALSKHSQKQVNHTDNRIDSIDKQETIEQETNKPLNNEQGNSIFLIPAMQEIWIKKNSTYIADNSKDYDSLLKIAKFICAGEKIDFKINEPECILKIKSTWEVISDFISNDSFFKTYNLILVEKHIQSIAQKIQHGTGNTVNGKTNRAVTGKQLDEAHSKYFGN